MRYDPRVHHRRSIRLKGYDYAQAGAYFVTICARGRECLFGEVADGEMRLSAWGAIVARCWDDLPGHYATVELDAFAVMPNHVHGIIVLTGPTAGGTTDSLDKTRHALPEIVRAFKAFSARRINEARGMVGTPVWQRGYYEHIIRTERSLGRIQEYVATNPALWEADQLHPDNPSPW